MAHVAVALAQEPLALEEDDAGERNGDGVERREGVGEAGAVYGARMANEGPAAEGSGRGGQDEYPQADTAVSYEVVASGAGLAGALPAPVDAVGPIANGEEDKPVQISQTSEPTPKAFGLSHALDGYHVCRGAHGAVFRLHEGDHVAVGL